MLRPDAPDTEVKCHDETPAHVHHGRAWSGNGNGYLHHAEQLFHFIRLADFVAFIESGLPLAVVFALVGLVADIANRNKSQTD